MLCECYWHIKVCFVSCAFCVWARVLYGCIVVIRVCCIGWVRCVLSVHSLVYSTAVVGCMLSVCEREVESMWPLLRETCLPDPSKPVSPPDQPALGRCVWPVSHPRKVFQSADCSGPRLRVQRWWWLGSLSSSDTFCSCFRVFPWGSSFSPSWGFLVHVAGSRFLSKCMRPLRLVKMDLTRNHQSPAAHNKRLFCETYSFTNNQTACSLKHSHITMLHTLVYSPFCRKAHLNIHKGESVSYH